MKLLSFFSLFAFVSASLVSLSSSSPSFNEVTRSSQKFILGEGNLMPLGTGFLQFAEAPGPESGANGLGRNQTLVLAKKRTERPDLLRGFKRYHGGWDITNRHYWWSVGFTGAAGFILAVVWFISFGIVLGVHHCCRRKFKIMDEGSNCSPRICLILLLVFTSASAIGCILLSVGQGEFHGEVMHTLKYVVNQSDYTVQTLKNVTEYLSQAKSINVEQFFLPADVKDKIDKLNVDLNSAADILSEKTSENSIKIKKVFKSMRSVLIVVAAVMLFVALLGLLLSILGHRHAINIFIFSGWLLVAITFIFCGVFLILNNAITDTCIAMEEWVNNPQAETALSNILPCVDQRTTNKTLSQSKEVIYNIVGVVNTAIYSSANTNPTPQAFGYYNQSGPMMPPLCSPFEFGLSDRPCEPQEISLTNASSVWQNYTCNATSSGICTTVGRLTPKFYTELIAAVNVSYALYHYTPPLLGLQDCNFVRETFKTITSDYCRPLENYLQMVVAGLGLISTGVMLCLILWIVYANRPQREEAFAKQSLQIKVVDNNGGNQSCSNNKLSPSSGGIVLDVSQVM